MKLRVQHRQGAQEKGRTAARQRSSRAPTSSPASRAQSRAGAAAGAVRSRRARVFAEQTLWQHVPPAAAATSAAGVPPKARPSHLPQPTGGKVRERAVPSTLQPRSGGVRLQRRCWWGRRDTSRQLAPVRRDESRPTRPAHPDQAGLAFRVGR